MSVRKSTKVLRSCEVCGSTWLVYPSRLKQSPERFCSHKCYAKTKFGEGRMPEPINRICIVCGTVFQLLPSAVAQRRGVYCSQKCHWIDRAKPLVERFHKHLGPTTDAGCILWNGAVNKAGYGTLGGPLAHRVAYELSYGQIPHGMCVLHRCDNPPCVNHEHLFLGTHRDNVDDKVAKNRQHKGEKMPQAKLTDSAVLEIRRLWESGSFTQQALANQFSVNRPAISKIVLRQRWKHI